MRISDWSSDVCSSDLLKATSPDEAVGLAAATRTKPWRWIASNGAFPFFAITGRKSVVSGKSVSVRVALGGRRIIKKQKHLKHKKYADHTDDNNNHKLLKSQ